MASAMTSTILRPTIPDQCPCVRRKPIESGHVPINGSTRFVCESARNNKLSTSEPLLSCPSFSETTSSILHPLSQSTEDPINTKPQLNLEQLPIELRQQIWEYVLGGHNFHLWMDRGRLRGVDCEWSDCTTCNVWCHNASLVRMLDEQKAAGKRQLLAILLTQKRIYFEAIGYLYSSNTFIISRTEIMEKLPSALSPQHLNRIRFVHFGIFLGCDPPLWTPREETWKRSWNTIALMQSLENLHVDLNGVWVWRGEYFNSESANKLFEPIKRVTRPKNFTLTVMTGKLENLKNPLMNCWWMAENGEKGERWEDLHCTVIRKEGEITRPFVKCKD